MMKVLLLVAALLSAAPPEVAVTLGKGAEAGGPLTVSSSDRGSDDLEVLREGEWSVGQLTVSAPAVAKDSVALTLRLRGAAALAPRPVLVRRGPVPMPGGGVVTQESYVTATRVDGADVVATVPFPPVADVADRYDLVDLTHAVDRVSEPELGEDPADRAPLGARRALVLLQGKSDGDPWRALRRSTKFEALREAYKPYVFRYPAYRAAKDNGAALARLVEQKLAAVGAGRMALVSHGRGAPVMRHAAAAMTRRVGLQIAFAGAHHGTIMASLLYANERLAEKVGRDAWLVLRHGQRGEPDTPGLRSACWDNHDGVVTAQQAREYGVRVNPELAAFNAARGHPAGADPGLAKLVCLQGDVTSLEGKAAVDGVAAEVLRKAAAAFHPVFGNIDPVVPFGSGVLEGSSRHQVHTYPGLDHAEVLARPEPWADAIGYLDQLAGGVSVTEASEFLRAR